MDVRGTPAPVRWRAADSSQVEAWATGSGWEIDYQQVGCGVYEARLAAIQLGSVIATSEVHNLAGAAWGTPADGTACLFLSVSSAPFLFRGSELGDGEAGFLHAGDDLAASYGSLGCRVLAITMARRDIADAVASWRHDPDQVLSTRGTIRVDPSRRRTLIEAIRDALRSPAPSPETHSDLEQELVSAFVDVLVSSQGPRWQSDRLTGYGQYVKRAQEYVHARLDQEIRVVDLAAAAGTTARTLQTAFRAVLGVSPMRYVRIRRLSQLRRNLLQGPQDQTITRLALRYGIKHLGRLSLDYRRLFGESPSATGVRTRVARPS